MNPLSSTIHPYKSIDSITLRPLRGITNVGRSRNVYKFSAVSPKEYSITAIPNILKFNHVEQKMNLTITVTANWSQILTKHGPDKYYFGWYAWTHQHHVVRSSVAVSFP